MYSLLEIRHNVQIKFYKYTSSIRVIAPHSRFNAIALWPPGVLRLLHAWLVPFFFLDFAPEVPENTQLIEVAPFEVFVSTCERSPNPFASLDIAREGLFFLLEDGDSVISCRHFGPELIFMLHSDRVDFRKVPG